MRRIGLLVLAALLAGACASRTLTIRSEPPGAAVRVNGEPVEGVTPVTVDASYDGVYRIELELAGHRRRVARFSTDPAWYEMFPADVATDFLNPASPDRAWEVVVALQPTDPGGVPPVVGDDEIERLVGAADAARARESGRK